MIFLLSSPAAAPGRAGRLWSAIRATALSLALVACGSDSSPPSLEGIAPAVGTSLGGNLVTLTGTGFVGQNSFRVTFDGVEATSVTLLDGRTATCLAPPGTPGAVVDVEIWSASGRDALPTAFGFHELPEASGLSITAGSALGGSLVELTGAGFLDDDAGLNQVEFDGVASPVVNVLSDTQLSVEVPSGVPGSTVDVVVSNANGQAVLSDGFTFHDSPTLTTVAPAVGTSLGSTAVTLTGTGFSDFDAGTNAVLFDGVPASSVVVLGDTQLTAVTPPGVPAAAVEVVLSNDNGLAALPAGFAFHPTPAVAAVTPSVGTSLGGTPVTATGSGYLDNDAGTLVLTFGGLPALNVVIVDDTTLTAETPVGVAGTLVDVVVSNDNGVGTLTEGFGLHALPTLGAVAPANGTSLGGTSVTLTGSGFLDNDSGAPTVTFDGLLASGVLVVDDATIVCTVPPGASGQSVDLEVVNANGSALLAGAYRYHAVPTLGSATPPSGTPIGGLTVTLNGSGFLVDAPGPNSVTFGGVAASDVTVIDDTTLTCVGPPGPDGTVVDIIVSNANGIAELSPGFIYHTAPLLVTVTPPSGPFTGGTAVTLFGAGFVIDGAGLNSVKFGTAAATSVVVVDDNTITCSVPAGSAGSSVTVQVSNTNGSPALVDGYAYHPEPTLVGASPATGSSLGGTTVTLTGTGFLDLGPGTNSVTFAGVPASSVVVLSDSMLTCVSPPGTAGSLVDIGLDNANGSASFANAFAYNLEPTLVAVAPPDGTSLGGTTVTLSGTGFLDNDPGTNSVTFDGVLASAVTVVDDGTLTCVVPAGTPGASVDVVLSNTNGSDSLASAFTYHDLPALTALVPAAGTSLGGTAVTVTGTGFLDDSAGTNTVTFDGALASNVTVLSDTTLSCSTPPGTAGATVEVVVTNANGASAPWNGFAYHPTPTVSAVVPAAGTSLGGTAVTVSGSGFVDNAAGPASVTFAGVAATSVTVVDDTTLTCTTPAGVAGAAVAVAVTNDNGSGALAGAFSYHALPTITSVAPSPGPPLGGASVTLTGTGFSANGAGSNAVTFGGLSATSIVVVDDTTLTCVTPGGTPGSSVDVVLLNDNGSGTLRAGYSYYPPPTVTGVSPTEGSSLGNTSVTITGTGFSANGPGASTVRFDGAAATSVVVLDDTSLTCLTPPGLPGANATISVSNDNGTGSLVSAFEYYPTPTLGSVSPEGGTSLGGLQVTLNGSGFVANGAGVNTVAFGGTPATSVTVLSDASITCVAPAGTAGTSVDVSVSNENGVATLSAAFTYHPLPVVMSVSPASSAQGGGITVTVDGSGFLANGAGTNTVAFGGTPATVVVVFSDTRLTCRVPAGTPGASVDVAVTNASGTGTLVGGYLYHAEPAVSSVSPSAGSSLGGTAVTLTGTGFEDFDAGSALVTFGGVSATGVVVVDDSTITCTTPPGSAGTAADVAVSNDNGSGTLSTGFNYYDTPTVSSISPTAGTSLGGTAITVTGTGFVTNGAGSNLVSIGGAAATSIVTVDDTTITCLTPAGAAGAAVDVVVGNSNGQGQLLAGFQYHAAPSIGSVTPSSGRWQGGTAVTISGTGFLDNAAGAITVTFDGGVATGTTVVNDTTLTCTTPTGTPAALADVVVSSDNGSATAVDAFTYYARPVVTAITPSSGTPLGGTVVTVTGAGFAVDSPGTNTITFGGVSVTGIMVVDDTTITCTTPASAVAGPVDVVLTNDNGSGTLSAGFTYHAAPTLQSISPNKGSGLGGTNVTLSGTGFLANAPGTTTLEVGGNPATNVVFLNDTTLTCRIPAGDPGTTVDVSLANANGSDTLSAAFTYHPAPTITSVAPASGTYLGDSTVTLTGTGFLANGAGASTVTFGGVAATEIVVFTNTTIQCLSPAGPAGSSVDVEVSNGNGTGTLTAGYAYHPLPTLTAVTPTAGTSLGGDALTLTGTGFEVNAPGPVSVTIGGIAATSVTVVDDTTITCTTPAGGAGTANDVMVANGNGSATLAAAFSFHGLPTLTSVTPAAGSSLGGTSVTLVGSGFEDFGAGVNAVTIGGQEATAVVVVNDTTITCTTPAGTPGAVEDVIVSNDNGAVTLANGYAYHALPTLTAVSPTTGSPSGGTPLTLTGSGFQVNSPGATTVTVGGVDATSVFVVSDSQLTCNAPAGTPGDTVDVVIANDNGSDVLSSSFTFYPPPTLGSVAPNHGPAPGGNTVTLTGSGFQDNLPGTVLVTFGGASATAVSVVSDTTLTCDPPSGVAGTAVDIVLSNDNGSDTLVSAYRYFDPPTVTSIVPAAGTSLGGTMVTIGGTGFLDNGAGSNALTFDGIAAGSVVVVNDTTITAVTPAGTAGDVIDVVVDNLNGSGTLVAGYTFHALPTLTVVAADFGTADGGTSVTLTGSGFLDDSPGTNLVTFGGLPAASITVVDDVTLTCDTPAGAQDTTVDVIVGNDNGSVTLSSGFRYNDPPVFWAVDKQWAVSGVAFSFTPTVVQPDASDSHAFTSTGTALPGWASLSPTTGEISGTPAPADQGLTSGVQLTVDDGSYTDGSNAFDLEVTGPATGLAYGVAPAATEQQEIVWPTFTVRVEDAGTNAVGAWSDPVTLSLASGTGALSGTLSRVPVDGVATFDDITYDTSEAITIDLTSPGVAGILGTAVTITAGPSTKLAFEVPPSAIEYRNVDFAFVLVEVQDATGSRLTTDNTTQVTLSLASGAGSLGGTLTRTAVAGRVVFDDITCSAANTITLRATSVPATTEPVTGAVVVRGNPASGLPPARASVDDFGVEGDQLSGSVSVSANGRFLAFESDATGLVADDTNGATDVFVHDRLTGSTTRVSLDSSSAQADGPSGAPALSADGRYVAFESTATNLVAGDTNGVSDVFLHDRESGTTVRVSLDSSSNQANGASEAPALSASGRFVVFESVATNLVAGDANAVRDTFLHDRASSETTRLSIDSMGSEANGASSAPVISGDGSTIAFHSAATNLVAGDTNGALDVFVHEPSSGTTSRVSVDSVGSEGSGDSTSPALSADGQVVAFASLATDLVAADTNGVRDVFVRDRGLSQTTRVSVDATGVEADAASDLPALSADGDRVVFQTAATTLLLGDTESQLDAYLHERSTSVVVRLSTSTTGGGGDGTSSGVAISSDGKHAAFTSLSTDLVSGDSNAVADAFLRPLHELPTLASVAPVAGSPIGGAAVTLTGSGFVTDSAGGNAVFFDGLAATNVVTTNDAIVTCDTPAGTPGATVDVIVVNNNGAATLAGSFTYRPTPTVMSVTPVVGPAAGGTAITLTGTGFTSTGFGSNSVTVGGAAATSVSTLNDTTITCVTPAGTPASSVDITVTNGNGSGTLTSGFGYHAPPTATAVSPNTGHADGGDVLTITGTGFLDNDASVNSVSFGGAAATSVVVVDDTTITCTHPAGTAGATVDVAVTNDNGTGTLTSGFTYHPVPVLTSVVPATGSPLGGTPVSLVGTGFQNGGIGSTSITFGGVAATSVTVIDDDTITCVAPSGSAEDLVDVVLTNGNGSSLLSDGFTFNPEPSIASASPNVGTSLGGTAITLTGSGFANNSAGATGVTFGGAPATSVVVQDDTTVTCVSPPGTPTSTVNIELTNGNGSAFLFSSHTYHPAPTIASATPSSGPVTGGTLLTLSGTGFLQNQAGTNAVTVGGGAATSVTVINNTTMTCVTPVSATSGRVDIVLSNANGSATLSDGFAYNLAPSVAAVTPPAGTSLGGTSVTITGSGFVAEGAGTNSVTFGGAAATSIVVIDDTTLNCVTPSGVAGASVDVAVSNSNGTGTASSGFMYHMAPTVSAVSPAAGTSLGGTAVTLTGTGFLVDDAGPAAVTFAGLAAANVAVVDDTTLTCTTPAGLEGTAVDVGITNDNGAGSLSSGFAYHGAPTVTGVTPAAGSPLGAGAVTVTGTGFQNNSAGTNLVTFGAGSASNVVVLNDTTLTCDAPGGSQGATVDVVVTNDNGTGTLTAGFSFHPAPSVTSVTPATGSLLGGTPVTIGGTGFTANDAGSAAVEFGGVAATNVVVVDDTTLTCTTPAGAEGAMVSVTVTNDNSSGSLAAGFSYNLAPTLATVAPTAGTSLGGTSITLTGTGLLDFGAGTNTVTIDGAAATNVVVVDDSTLICESPSGSAGALADVEVSNTNGTAMLGSSYAYHPTPSVASISPNGGTPVGGTTITISGTGFSDNQAGASSVTFDGALATSVVVLDDNTITCSTPAGSPSAVVDVVVTNDNGAGTGTALFTYHASPTVTAIAPAVGTALGGTSVTLSGTGFVAAGAGTNAVFIDGAAATSISVVSDTTITCVTPAGMPGLGADVVVTNSNGSGSLVGGFGYHSAPSITSVSPPSGTSSGGTSLTITGSGFTANDAGTTTLTIGGLTPGSLVVLDDSTITCVSLAGTPGASVDLAVENDNGAGLLSGGFQYNAYPTLSAISPAAGSSLGGSTTTLSGTGFQDFAPGTNTVTFGGVAATSVVVVDDTTLTCETPTGTAGAAVDVSLSNGNGSDTLSAGWSYHPRPTVSGVVPPNGTSLGGSAVTISGAGFLDLAAGTNTVRFGGVDATSVVVVDDATLTCVAPAGAAGTSVDVAVLNDNGTATLATGFTYHASPTVTGSSPSGATSLGGTTITLTGTGFQANQAGTNTVRLNGTLASNVVVLGDTSLSCETPAGVPGPVTLEVTNDNGAGTQAGAFAYFAAPTISALSPPAGAWQGGTAVTLTGSGFADNLAGTNAVTVGGVSATDLVVVDDSTLTLSTPPGSPGANVDVVLDNANGSGTLSAGFHFHSDLALDLDDDGIGDLVVGAPAAAGGLGSAYVILGNDAGLADMGAAAADVTITGTEAGGGFGAAFAVGDVDDDGYADVAVGAPSASKVYVFLGPLVSGTTLSTSAADVTIDGVGSTDSFGGALVIGDLDGNGVADLVVGAPARGAGNEGAVHVFLGGTGFSPTNAALADHELAGVAGDGLGAALAIGDLDADTVPDLAVGAPDNDRAYVVFGGVSFAGGSIVGADAVLDAESAGDQLGRSLAWGDVTGDGQGDLVVGAPGTDVVGTDAGSAYVFAGGVGFASLAAGSATVVVRAQAAGDGLGASVCVGDLTGDSTPELLLGAAGWDLDGATTGVGRAYLFVGGSLSASMFASAADAIFTGVAASDELFGTALTATDLDDDGLADLVVGAPGCDIGGTDAGAAHLFHGTALPTDRSAASDDVTISGAAAGDGLGQTLADH